MKWSGMIGFMIQKETSPGIWESIFVERKYIGDLSNRSYRYQNSNEVHDDVSVSNTISIVSDSYIHDNYGYIRYVTYKGFKWKVDNIKISAPRILLTLGGMFNENTPSTS